MARISVTRNDSFWFGMTTFAGLVCGLIYTVLWRLSFHFAPDVEQTERPLMLVLALLALSFVVYLFGQWSALHTASAWLTATLIAFALGFRLIMLGSQPIQEIDIYRYVWDGVATVNGVSPFEYSPASVLEADQSGDLPPELRRLAQARDASPAAHAILSRIHFAELPTVYPPASQVVFAAAVWSTPGEANESTRLLVMKAWLLLFDVGIIFLVATTLRFAGMHPGWLVSYAWCPLVLKEFANSGHLDSIAVFFTGLAVWLAITVFFRSAESSKPAPTVGWQFARLLLASVILALGVGAKLYPVVLVPLLATTAWRRVGIQQTLCLALVWCATTTLVLYPMLGASSEPTVELSDASDPFATVSQTPSPNAGADRRAGLQAFLSHWMMNDFIFLNLSENLKPSSVRGDDPEPWFVVAPNAWRESLASIANTKFGIPPDRVAFVLARAITGVLFLGLAIIWAWQAGRTDCSQRWCEYVFLTLAWFWLLLPTLNPWYWIWALPFVPFARNRVWLMLSGLVLIYYLRFHLDAWFVDAPVVAWLPYRGAEFFDYVVVWFEYLPWFICLIAFFVLARRKRSTT